jgi:ribonucleoside-diphosphate reductase alpha chain
MTETISGTARKASHAGGPQPQPAAPAGKQAGAAGGANRAGAPTRGGLKIERIFTTPGVHPYDEVEWERRDVVMTNWRDGSINFEQQGVEFPAFWSANAANIVTTKYFRGAQGTEKREWSLKQVVDRVVKTYRRAGEEFGYFASPEDAEVFEHELTHALVHQVFSFNSPVWFNVGTQSRQQVSACFILAVDDTMDSILNWYREEGLIFKGGSGAGLNLSRIRSSRELLSSGGNASGPVSFMRGADASAGTIKSGGATRRAAKMVVLDVDHPDVREFVWTKAREEDKIRVLRDAGFDMDLGGADITSVQYQNANNSVRVNDAFMRAVEENASYDLVARDAEHTVIETIDAKDLFRQMAQAAWACADPGIQYDGTINAWHTNPNTGRISASNPCSEYMSLDNSSCNLASLNLMKFLRDADAEPDSKPSFDTATFAKVVELVITAMDISICFADFPTEPITKTTRDYRQLGIGYANLGALLMATGHAYDSDGGRAIAAAVTALMTGTAYKRSAELAGVVGPYAGYAANAEPHTAVMRKHAAATDAIEAFEPFDADIKTAAQTAWTASIETGLRNGWRNAQASLLAPTGCLVPETMVTTDRGLFRLDELGDVYGDRWQDVDFKVSTDDGAKQATKFFVNGEEPTRRIVTSGGYQIQGTTAHRVKVVDPENGEWVWKRLADVAEGDLLPIQLRTLVGSPRKVPLPVLDQAYYTDDQRLVVPDAVDADLAELVGYFMGDGSLHAKGLRFAVADTDLDVATRLGVLGKQLFGIEAAVTELEGYHEVAFNSVRLARWWRAAGFAKLLPTEDHSGKGWTPRVPTAIRETNDAEVYAAFLRGLFEADGTVLGGTPSVSTSSTAFAAEIRTLMLAVGLVTTTRETRSGWGGPIQQVRLRNIDHALRFDELVGFVGERKARLIAELETPQSGKGDLIYLPAEAWRQLMPQDGRADKIRQSLRKAGGVPRLVATELFQETLDDRLAFALDYVFERVGANEDGGVQPTYDLSVPENVTYVANGFVSHNTIGFMMDVDTTGIEPDLALVKFKKLVGGGSMQIVNNTVPRALRKLGYHEEQIEAVVEYIAEHGHVVDAPGLKQAHYEVFDCAMGDRSIAPMGHVKMMAAVQPHLSGAISKTVNMPESATVEEIEEIYFEGWKLGLKALAIYRNNCKVGQPLQDAKGAKRAAAAEAAEAEAKAAGAGSGTAAAPEREREVVVEYKPVRKRLPKNRPGSTTSFSVGGAEGYMISNSYPDDGLGEVFLKMSKQGSTLAGMMDAFSIAISVGLQYGVPLETYVAKFTNMRFEPAGLTDDPDVRMAQSILDYIFRRLALDHLPFDVRADYGIYSATERQRQVETGSYLPSDDDADLTEIAQSAPIEDRAPKPGPAKAEIEAKAKAKDDAKDRSSAAAGGDTDRSIRAVSQAATPTRAGSSMEVLEAKVGHAADAPLCMTCGTKMRPAGSCYACEGCGSTSGCS